MGRNGKTEPVFPAMIAFLNEHVGEIVTSEQILFGEKPGRTVKTAYLYKFVKLGYVEPTNGSFVKDENAKFKVLKPFPKHYNSVMLTDELRVANGLIPKSHKRQIY